MCFLVMIFASKCSLQMSNKTKNYVKNPASAEFCSVDLFTHHWHTCVFIYLMPIDFLSPYLLALLHIVVYNINFKNEEITNY